MIRYYFYALANFLAAFGGGVILGKGISVLNGTMFEGGSILAFFVGTVLGLVFLQLIPKRCSVRLARWFSVGGALASLALLGVYLNFAVDGRLGGRVASCFFALLSLRFGLWFYSRVMRAGAAAGRDQKIAWVELGYYLGTSMGLVI